MLKLMFIRQWNLIEQQYALLKNIRIFDNQIKLTEKQTQRKMDCLEALDKKFCRICYQESSQDEFQRSNFIRPCKCIDDVHISCLLKWANSQTSKYRANFKKNQNPKCQVCCQQLYFKKSCQFIARQNEEMKNSIKRMPTFFISGICLILLCLSGLSFLTYLCAFQRCTFNSQSSEIVIIAWIILPIFLLFWIYVLTLNFFVKKNDYYSQVLINQHQIGKEDEHQTFITKKLGFLNFLPVFNREALNCFNINRKQ